MRQGFRMQHLNRAGTWPSGNPRIYYRPKGQKGIALPDLSESHPLFIAAYLKVSGLIELPPPTTATGTIGRAIEAFIASDDYLARAASTRSVWRRYLDDIKSRYGAERLSGLRPQHIARDLSRLTPHPANNRRKAWRALAEFWKSSGLLETNVAQGVDKRRTPTTDGRIAWTQGDVDLFRARWPLESQQRLAFEILLYTACRIGDAVALSDAHVDRTGWLTFTQEKTGQPVSIPFKATVPAYTGPPIELIEALGARPVRHLVWLTTAQGKSRSKKSVSQWFSQAATIAGLDREKSAHGIRKLRLTILKERGANIDQRKAWGGHEDDASANYYTKSADLQTIIMGPKQEQKVPTQYEPVPTFASKYQK